MSPFPASRTCYYCLLEDERVEAGGVYYCPNVLCTGPGPLGFRSRLKSFANIDDSTYTLDTNELVAAARVHAESLPAEDHALAAHILASIPQWLKQPTGTGS